jgi:uncharacterized protein (DUF2062 family)
VGNILPYLKDKIIGFVRRLLSLRATPHQIAIGFAIGVFIGIFPTFGFGGLVILAIVPLWKFNLPAALLGTIMGNPLFAPLWIALTCLVTRISPEEVKLPQETFNQILVHYSQIGLRYLLGNLGISLVVAIISYFSILRAVHWFKQNTGKTVFN